MMDSNRRSLLKSIGSSLALIPVATESFGKSLVHSRPKIGLIGCGGRAKSLLSEFKTISDIHWVCDPDKLRLAEFAESFKAPNRTTDLREVLEDKSVQAVVIATPDHWHAPAAIMACNAGKHVYVEKPCSHNLMEGKMLVEAARRNQVVVQHGTQSRTNRLIVNAIQLIQEGAIGNVLMAKAWNIQRRKNIGTASPKPVPSHVDYDTWVGPAEFMPYQENRFHYDWHWWHNFGTGDIGNDGTHEIDIARWGLNVQGLPSSASALGGKYYFDDDQQFPDTATCVFEWPHDGKVGQRRQLIFEMRIWSKNYPYNCDTGVEFYGTKGMLFVSKRGKLMLWNEDNKLVESPQPKELVRLPQSHQADFLEAIAEGRKPAADIELGHDSVSLIHLANISVRTGRSLRLDPIAGSILGDEQSNSMLGRKYREQGHWAIPKSAPTS
jgi:predicted dehydrogenase